MLPASFGLIAAAALIGAVLALLHLRPAGPAPRWQFGALHGAIGASGLAALFLALQGPPRGVSLGVGPFGLFSAAVLALALLAGLTLLAALWLGRRHGFLMGLHAALAVTGFVILAAYMVLGG